MFGNVLGWVISAVIVALTTIAMSAFYVAGAYISPPGTVGRNAASYSMQLPLDPRSLDHLLVRGLDVIEPEHALPSPAREVPGPAGRVVRLSDHRLLAGTFGMK